MQQWISINISFFGLGSITPPEKKTERRSAVCSANIIFHSGRLDI